MARFFCCCCGSWNRVHPLENILEIHNDGEITDSEILEVTRSSDVSYLTDLAATWHSKQYLTCVCVRIESTSSCLQV